LINNHGYAHGCDLLARRLPRAWLLALASPHAACRELTWVLLSGEQPVTGE
jgi:hypothetical protein